MWIGVSWHEVEYIQELYESTNEPLVSVNYREFFTN
jgi:hypothetical protein